MKKAFSFMELILVIILISLIYMIFIPNLKLPLKKQQFLTLDNLKSQLLKNEFEESLLFSCIEKDFECFVFIDGKLKKELGIKNFFEIKPEVYKYDNILNRVKFNDLKFDTFEDFSVVFELKFDKYKHHKDMVVETNHGIYILNAVLKEPIKLEYLNDVYDYRDRLAREIKNAF
ncbi:hypothetical protein CRV08_08665 [Halarcobacter ebronensis]|uniref:Prepilin-type cleavage/methylation domain-containing protein n=1 Tax=Halarcobacter ebronensis TaxID=1462615 RepID=A0A4Q0YDY6_9BACT|nr:hypothetical protein [Halarcobacter ebronensis]RXJ68313.1 hypothetical protein CRV08_08665 [Halarcobacter ebronensis]